MPQYGDSRSSKLGLAAKWLAQPPLPNSQIPWAGSTIRPVSPAIPETVACPPVNVGTAGTRTELQNALARPGWQVLNAYLAAKISEREAARRFTQPQLNSGIGDAWRHFRWNFAMARSMGTPAARAFANAHEIKAGNPPDERAMDLYNNAMGRAFGRGKAYAKMTPNQVAALARRSGCLKILHD